MTQILSAKPILDAELTKLEARVVQQRKKGIIPFLKVFLVGNDPASVIYTNNKKKLCEKIGAKCEIVILPETIKQQDFVQTLENANQDPMVHGIIIQLPVPAQLKALDLNSIVKKEKDVDGFNPHNLLTLLQGNINAQSLIPCTPKGIIKLLEFYKISLEAKNVVVIGRSLIVGKPMSLLFNHYNATVTMCHSKTKNLKEITKQADIVVVAIGKPKFLTKDYFSESTNTVVIDVGMNRDQNSQWCGDVDFEQVQNHVQAITPVPGGVGPLTVLSLVDNLINASENL